MTYSGENKKQQHQIHELFNYADGNDDILSDTGDQGDIRRGMWAQEPYTVGDGSGVINEKFINFVNNRDNYPNKPINNIKLLSEHFQECVGNLSEVMKVVEDKPKFLNNLKALNEYMIRREIFTMDEDGSSKFSTSDAVGQDSFPSYDNTADTSPCINNSLDANIAMYEDLIYKHVVGDATEDKYQISEVVEGGEFTAYHGSDKKINKFVDDFVGTDEAIDQEGPGIYFTTNADDARAHGNFLHSVILRPRKLLDQSSHENIDENIILNLLKTAPDWEGTAQNWAEDPNEGVMNAVDAMMQYSENEVDLFQQVWFDFYRHNPVEFLRAMVKLGYDGQIIEKVDDIKHIIVYNPDIIEQTNTEELSEEVIPYSEDGDNYNDYDYDKIYNQIQEITKNSGINILSDKQLTGFVLKDNNAVGAIFSSLDNNKKEFSFDVVVDEKYRGTGIGRELTQDGIDQYESYRDMFEGDELRLILDVVNPNMRELLKKYFNFNDVQRIGTDRYMMSMNEVRKKSYMPGSKTVKVKRKCQLGGKADGTSDACNQGDINNLEFGSVKEDLDVNEYFSSLVPDMNEQGIMSIQDLPFKNEVEQLGGKIFSVGGAVRDEFLGKESKDLDILVTGIPMDRLAELMSRHGRVDAVGQSFGVLKFKPQGSSEEIDVAIPRTEVATGAGGHKGFDVSSDHELPIEKDLERRDFTINAIAKDMDGNLIDPYGGQKDLQNKIIRVVNPEAFSDDPLRMLRAVQFASRFGFSIEPKTAKMIKDNSARIKEIPPERILTEFDKIVQKGNKLTGAFLLKDLSLTKEIFGTDGGLYLGNEWNDVKTMGEFIWLLGHHLVPDIAEFFKNNLKGDLDAYKEIKALDYASQADDNANPIIARSVAHNMYRISPKTLESQIIPDVIKRAGQELNAGKYPKTFTELAVNGNDLMNNGLQGKEIGDTLKSLLMKVYADNVRNDREELLSLVKDSNGAVEENYDQYSKKSPDVWDVNGESVEIDFFVDAYDKWNKKTATSKGYVNDPTRESVYEFIQDNFEDLLGDEKLLRNLYWKLIDRELLNEEEEVEKVRYTAVVLDDDSRASLIKVFHQMIPEDWELVAHHMTINMGEINEVYQDLLGIDAKLTVTSYAIDDKVMAVGVKGCPTVNEIPHITVAVNRKAGGKPYLSNKLRNWKPINFPIDLTGKVTEVKY